MTNITLESLAAENKVLKNQLAQFKYFMTGSRVEIRCVDDVEIGQTIYCERADLHGVAAGFLQSAEVCADVGPGLRPQRLLNCSVHLCVEPYKPYAEKLVQSYPSKPVIVADGVDYLSHALTGSVDIVFLLDVIEHLEKDQGLILLKEARRVARKQVVVFTPLGFMPQHYTDAAPWDGVEHSDLQNHRSGWLPEEFTGARHVVCTDYHESEKEIFGAFYSIIDVSHRQSPRLVLVSEDLPEDFILHADDVVISDAAFSELSWKINTVPKRNYIVVPLQIIAEEGSLPKAILRRAVLNFGILEGYLERFENIVAVGISAEVVLQRHRAGWA